MAARRAVRSGTRGTTTRSLHSPVDLGQDLCLLRRSHSGGRRRAQADLFRGIKDGGTSSFVSRVYVLPLATGGWTFGISHSSTSATVGVAAWPSALSYDTNYHLVINYDPVAKTSTLWVNPTAEADPSVSIANPAIAALAVSTFALRQSNSASALPPNPLYSGSADWNFSVDNLGVGTTFDEACSIPTPTKPATWGALKGLYR